MSNIFIPGPDSFVILMTYNFTAAITSILMEFQTLRFTVQLCMLSNIQYAISMRQKTDKIKRKTLAVPTFDFFFNILFEWAMT